MSLFCRYVSKPQQREWNANKRVMQHLKQTQDMNLRLSANGGPELMGYVDWVWAGDPFTCKFTGV